MTAYSERGSFASDAGENSPDLLSITTLILWLVALAVGVLGLRIPYPLPQPPAAPVSPVQTQIVNVDVPTPPAPPPELQPPAPDPAASSTPTDIPVALAAPALPAAPPIAVAQPSAAVAFALPVEGYTKIVDVSRAAHGRPSQSGPGAGTGTSSAPHPGPSSPIAPPVPAPAAPAVTHITFGEGAGNQPAPEYPREAVAAHQEGTVTLRFSVDETGSVTKVDIITPAKWPLLNKAAAKTIKDSWHFPPGNPRLYEVPIQFQLTQ